MTPESPSPREQGPSPSGGAAEPGLILAYGAGRRTGGQRTATIGRSLRRKGREEEDLTPAEAAALLLVGAHLRVRPQSGRTPRSAPTKKYYLYERNLVLAAILLLPPKF